MDAKLQELCRQAHEDRIRVGMLDTDTKNRTLELAADALMRSFDRWCPQPARACWAWSGRRC